MNCIPLKDINQNSYRVKICARVTRLSQFILEDKPNLVLRLDFVLLDHERNAIEAQVSQKHVDRYTSLLKEGVAYFIEFFQVVPAKTNYQAVDHMYMIRFTSHTKLSEFHDVPETFPRYAYTLLSFDALRTRIDYTKHMSDTIGRLVSVEPITTAHVKGVSKPKRHLYISDEREYVEVVLWNRQATEFPAEQIINSSKERPIILLLLGITVKSREGQLKIQASTTCQYHVNPPILEATALEKRFAALPHQVALAGSIATTSDVINTSVGELAKMTNPHELCGIIYQVDVALKTLSPNQPWWYLGCISCKKRVFPEGDTYRCPKCSGNKSEPMYRITVIAGDPHNFMEDNAPTIEIIFFGAIGEELIGIQALHLAALYNAAIPSELTRLYNQKYTLTISVPLSSMQRENISFRTKSIVAIGGPLIIAPPMHHTSSGTHQHQTASTEQTTNLTCLPPGTATASKGKNPPHQEDNTGTPLPSPQRLETMISQPTTTNVSTSEAAYLQNDLPSTSRVRLSSPTDGEETRRVRRRLQVD